MQRMLARKGTRSLVLEDFFFCGFQLCHWLKHTIATLKNSNNNKGKKTQRKNPKQTNKTQSTNLALATRQSSFSCGVLWSFTLLPVKIELLISRWALNGLPPNGESNRSLCIFGKSHTFYWLLLSVQRETVFLGSLLSSFLPADWKPVKCWRLRAVIVLLSWFQKFYFSIKGGT